MGEDEVGEFALAAGGGELRIRVGWRRRGGGGVGGCRWDGAGGGVGAIVWRVREGHV